MHFTLDMFGLLVRPRVIVNASIAPLGSKFSEPTWSTPGKATKAPFHHRSIYSNFPTPIKNLFVDMSLGDTTKDLATCYVAEVTHYVVKIASQYIVVEPSTILETLKLAKNRLGTHTNLNIRAVGVKFYFGAERQLDGSYKGINPWHPKTVIDQEAIWFYEPWELVPFTHIVRYESLEQTNMLLFQKSTGLVVKKNFLNKPKFYSTSSWSCYSIILLNHTADGYTRLLPDRNFTIHKATKTVANQD